MNLKIVQLYLYCKSFSSFIFVAESSRLSFENFCQFSHILRERGDENCAVFLRKRTENTFCGEEIARKYIIKLGISVMTN